MIGKNSEHGSKYCISINKMPLNVITDSKLSQNMFSMFYEIFAVLIHQVNRHLF